MIPTAEIKINLTPALRLEQALKAAGIEDAASVRKLTIAGRLTADDCRYIRFKMHKTLQELDISNATFNRKSIPGDGFADCIGLLSITFPASIVIMDLYSKVEMDLLSLKSCRSLNNIAVHPDNPAFASENGVLFNKDKTTLLLYPTGRRDDDVYVIPDTVVKIARFAFYFCHGLTSVFIPKSVRKIEFHVFNGCHNLTAVTVHPDNPKYASENGILLNKYKTELIYYPEGRQGECIIPDKVETIGIWSFMGRRKGLTSITFPASIEYSHRNINRFKDCVDLTAFLLHPDSPFVEDKGTVYRKPKVDGSFPYSVLYPTGRHGDFYIPAAVDYFPNIALKDCRNITSVTVHPDNKYFESENGIAFYSGKVRLKFCPRGKQGDCFIPASTTELAEYSLENCFDLTSVTVHPDNPEFASENGVLFNKDKTEMIYFPEGWQGDYTIPETVTVIDLQNLEQAPGLTSISIHPDNTEYTSENGVLFYKDKTALALYPRGKKGDLFIPASLIDDNIIIDIFDCPGITSVTVPPDNPVYSSENGILFNKDKTKLIFCPENMKADFTIPDSVVKIGYWFFTASDSYENICDYHCYADFENADIW